MRKFSRSAVAGFLVLVLLTLTFLTGCGAASSVSTDDSAGKIKIGLTQFATHPAADAGRQGFIEALKTAGYVEGKNLILDFQNPEGDTAAGIKIARKFVDEKVDLIFSFGTGVSQAAVSAARGSGIPVLFCSVTDPVGAGLVADFQHPGENVSGTCDLLDVGLALDMMRQMVPGLQNLGTLYNYAEQNSVTLVENLRQIAEADGIHIEKRLVTRGAEVENAAQSLVGKVDAVWIGTDNTVVSGLSGLIKVTQSNRLPFFPSDDASVKAGGIACLGLDDYQIGYQTGLMAVRILQGTSAEQIPVERAYNYIYSVNLKAAQVYGVSVPPSILEQAANTFNE